MLDYPLPEEIVPVQSKLPPVQREIVSLCSIACHLRKKNTTYLTAASLQEVVESDEIYPQPPPD